MSDAHRLVVTLELKGPATRGDLLALLARNASPDVSIDLLGVEEGAGFDGTTAVTIAVSWVAAIGTNVVANVLYDSLGSRIRRSMLNRRRVRPTREALAAALDEATRLLEALAAEEADGRSSDEPRGGDDG